jgi:trans-2,3-dihydro-3-hydroxyanthranilate isomerase
VLAEALGLAAADITASPPPQVVSCGVPFLLVALRDLDALARARPRLERWSPLATRLGDPGIYCYTLATSESGITVRSRMFAPELGVGEDPATGGASGPLGCHLVRHGAVPAGRPARILNVQGVEMGRRSEIHIEVDGDTVRVGGECVAVGEGTLDLGD